MSKVEGERGKTGQIGEDWDHRFDIPQIGEGNEFNIAVLSCYQHHPDIPIYLFTNAKYINRRTRQMIYRIFEVDLLVESELDRNVKYIGDAKFGFGTKAQSVVTGWKWGVLPDMVLHLDVDIVIIETSPRWNLHSMFKPLQVIIYSYRHFPP